MIENLCKEYTNLNSHDIEKIIEVSKSLDLIAQFHESDVFIDVLCKDKEYAIVVAHSSPNDKSLYKDIVVGKKAYEENEPGALNTLKTGVPSKDIRALTQEYKLVKQTVHPINLNSKVVAVLIVEKDISEELTNKFEINSYDKKDSDDFMNLINKNRVITDHLNSGIFIFDNKGILKIANNNAADIYKSLGYTKEIKGMHYDDLSLQCDKFENIVNLKSLSSSSTEEKIKIKDYYLKIKTLQMYDGEFKLVKIIQDLTEEKKKEEELVFKSVAIKEAHHRIKNNLQTVVALLRKQSRSTDDENVRQCLENTISRVFTILSTHHLLSKRNDNTINVLESINLLISNIQSGYNDNKNINIYVTGDDFEISGDKATALLLIINEVIQNCYDHAFKNHDSGNIQILINTDEDYKNIVIVDDGVGFNMDNVDKKSLGMYIINSYAKGVLDGDIEINSDKKGTKVILKVKL
ncbi:histidine kinase [Romboutsia maritimum]|uniref:histidine kinase n=1 Tax=Romboutsia maritimum TaxID=2020948 RepID=A0A371ISP4_9FIRM|nr:sensor histidine kinase [Romboutsia maritimum]RDY23501.1 histidine kinase [Romboutsia maritimum]